jgi:hypothetical protein
MVLYILKKKVFPFWDFFKSEKRKIFPESLRDRRFSYVLTINSFLSPIPEDFRHPKLTIGSFEGDGTLITIL